MDPQPEDVLEWATRGSARVLGMEEQVGSLEVGKKADLFIIDAMRPHLVPNLRIVSAFVHNGQGSDVVSVMVDGRWLMRDGKVLTIDEADIVQRAEEMGHSLWRRLLDHYPDIPFPFTLPPRG
ncbi:MAG: amidohydrolase family protein, partial [Dehalococcoidia bacterium]